MDRHEGHWRELSVLDVRDFNSPDSEGHWPCIVCGEAFAVSESWHIRLEGSAAVVTCRRCADHARRNGKVTIPADTTVRLDQSWATDPGGGDQIR